MIRGMGGFRLRRFRLSIFIFISNMAVLSPFIQEVTIPRSSFHESLDMLQQLATDGILYLAYGIAILSVFKFILGIINGVTSNSSMGARTMDDSSLFRGTYRFGESKDATI